MSSVMFSESSEEIEPERATAESSWPHRFASTSIEGQRPGGSLRSRAEGHHRTATTTLPATLLALHNAVDYSIARHPRVLSTASTVLTTVGGIILFPGVSAYARGTILAHPAVTIAGGIALVVGRWLRRALNSAAASAAAQEQASGQVTTEDVDDRRQDRTDPVGLLSSDFIV